MTILNLKALMGIVMLELFSERQFRQSFSYHDAVVSSTPPLKSFTVDATFTKPYVGHSQRSINVFNVFHHHNQCFAKQQKQSLVCVSKSNNDDAKPKKKMITNASRRRQIKDDKVSPVSKEIYSVDKNFENTFENKTNVEIESSIEVKAVPSPNFVFELKPEAKGSSGDVVEYTRSKRKKKSMNLGVSFINSIMKEYVDVPGSHGMKILKNVFELETGKTNSTIVVRNITEAFWKTAIQVAETPNFRYRVCAVGTPGIGKTKTTAILIRLLLQQNRTVVYHVRTEKETGWIYEFKPTQFAINGNVSKIEVDIFPEKDFDIESIPSQENDPSNYYVVDPGETKTNCCPSRIYKGRFILVSSPDDCHWGGSEFLKQREDTMGEFLFHPLWRLDELLNARPHIPNNLSVDEVVERYSQVGGVPRHVFANPADLAKILASQSKAVERLTADQLESIVRNEWDNVETFSRNQPKSLLMGYGWSGDRFNETNAVAISYGVVGKIVKRHIRFLWDKITTPGIGEGWMMFETFCKNLMLGSPYTSSCRECVGKEKSKRKSALQNVSRIDVPDTAKADLSKDDNTDLGIKQNTVSLGGCKSIKLAHGDIIEAAKKTPMVIFHSADPAYKLIDFAYQNDGIFYAFQVTIGQSHEANITEIWKLAKAVGGPQFLQLYYLVPSKNFNSFVTDPVNPGKGIQKLINDDRRKSNYIEGESSNLENELDRNWTIRVFAINNPNSEVDTLL